MSDISRYRDAYIAEVATTVAVRDKLKEDEEQASKRFKEAQATRATRRATHKQRLFELQRMAVVMGVISRDVVDALIPLHERTSCSDKQPDNVKRCARCSLLYILNHPDELQDRVLRLTVVSASEVDD